MKRGVARTGSGATAGAGVPRTPSGTERVFLSLPEVRGNSGAVVSSDDSQGGAPARAQRNVGHGQSVGSVPSRTAPYTSIAVPSDRIAIRTGNQVNRREIPAKNSTMAKNTVANT